MRFQPIKQINTIWQQEYFEPTISWSIRVVLALNIPLIVFPLFIGFSYQIIWAALAAYMVTFIDYRGPYLKKIGIQAVEGVLIFCASIIGLNIGNSITLAVITMFFIGLFIALIRNWSNYGSSIGIGVGFFYLLGTANPTNTFSESLIYGYYTLCGTLWAISIIFISYLFIASNPLRRSVATIWKKNTEYLDEVLVNFVDDFVDNNELRTITQKELEIRQAIDNSINHFERRKANSKLKANHYDKVIEIRKIAAYFGASLRVLHEELNLLKNTYLQKNDSTLYKTISALSQASARLSILIFTFRGEDLTMAKVRIRRFEIAVTIFKKNIDYERFNAEEKIALKELISHLEQCYGYLANTLDLVQMRMNLKDNSYFENYKLSFNHFIHGLKPRVFIQYMSEMFNFNSQQFNYSMRVGFGMAFSLFLFLYFKIDHGYWIALTMLIVIQPYYGATRKKGIERVIGTIIGIAVGGLIMLFPLPHHYLVIILIFISFFLAYFIRNNYKLGVFFVTIMLVIMMQMSEQGSWELIGWRVFSTIIGSLLAIAISSVFWPVWEKQRFPNFMKLANIKNDAFLQEVFNSYVSKKKETNWHVSRRASEAANHNLFASIQRMYEEPQEHQREIDVLFAKVGASIRISREITSLGFKLEKLEYLEDLAKVLSEFQHQSHLIYQSMINKSEIQDFTNLKSITKIPLFQESETLNSIRVDLEKITFELEALSSFQKVA